MTDQLPQTQPPPGPAEGQGTRRRTPNRLVFVVALAVFGIAAVAFVLLWFEPQQLFIDERVSDPVPLVGPSAPADVDGEAQPAPAVPREPTVLLRGELVSRDHGTSGSVQFLELADGSRILRLDDLDTDNGPDLYVYLSTNTADGDEGAFDDDHLNLGRLKGNLGDQNYEVPAGVDVARFRSVVIWCDRFDSAFGAADLVRA